MPFTEEDLKAFGDKLMNPLTLTQAELDAIRARAEAATPGEDYSSGRIGLTFTAQGTDEFACIWYDDGDLCAEVHGNLGLGIYDPTPYADLFAHSRTDIPALLLEIEALRRACYHYATQVGRWAERGKK